MNFRAKGLVIVAPLVFAAIFISGYYWFRSPSHLSSPKSTASAGDPQISLEVTTVPGNNSLVVTWQDLASSTRELRVYRAHKGTNNWSFWKNISVPSGSQAGNAAALTGSGASFSTYSYYVQAMGGGGPPAGGSGGSGGGGGSPPQEVLWTSPPEDPPVSPSPPPPSPSPSPQSGGTSPPPIPTFQVSHSNNLVEVTWQDLPAATTFLVISRSQNPGGPWGTFFTETNPITKGPYTARIADTTPAISYYYEITVYNGTTPINTYGPIYVSAL